MAEKAFAEWDLATSLSFGLENQKLKIHIIRNDNWDYRSTLYLLYVFSGLVSAPFTVFSPTPVREVLALFHVKGSLTRDF